jgi:putative flippase GtrA
VLPRLLSLGKRLPRRVRRLATPTRARTLAQFVQFGIVGGIGFVFDTAVVYALRRSLGLYVAGVAAYLVAATVTWALNRAYTFRGASRAPAHVQWAKFLLANLFGFVLNRGTYAVLVTAVPLCAEQPVLAVAAGCLAGMFVNFSLTRRMVFR